MAGVDNGASQADVTRVFPNQRVAIERSIGKRLIISQIEAHNVRMNAHNLHNPRRGFGLLDEVTVVAPRIAHNTT